MQRLVFRADGDARTGLGHLYRVMALMEALKDHHQCTLITRSETENIVPKHLEVVRLPSANGHDDIDWLVSHYPPSACDIVADGYHFDAPWQKKLKQQGYFLLLVDDLVRGHYYADVVVNHAISARALDYDAGPGTRFALGTRFAMLRPAFMARAGKTRRPSGKLETALVAFGGADPMDLTHKAATALAGMPGIEAIHVVAGAMFGNEKTDALRKISPRVTVHVSLGENEMAAVMDACDFAVTSASNVLYEVCAVKMPVLAGYYVENQLGLYNGLLQKHAIFGGGNFSAFGVSEFGVMIKEFLAGDHRAQLVAQAALFDGQSARRLAGLTQRITYRKAGEGDMQLVYKWSNDPLTRENSYHSASIALADHEKWFRGKLSDAAAGLFIALVEGRPAGLVRYDAHEDHTVVGVTLDEASRGRSLAQVFLRDTARLYFLERKLPVLAYIKKTNVASVRAFEQAGYRPAGEEPVKGIPSFVYKLEREDV